MTEHLIVTIKHPTKGIVFQGLVPYDDVRITREINKPTTATLRMPLMDMTAHLRKAHVKEQ